MVFTTVFLAELGDKTQLATVLFAADDRNSRWSVFWSASAALVLGSFLSVIAGSVLPQYVSPRGIKLMGGFGFIAIGLWILFDSHN
jgi:putative Ca2+/H+ antiporter (TMEM165/GDT1 family)